MGYSLTRAAVLRNREQLEQLLKLKTTLVFRNIQNPSRLAYKLREAIAAAEQFEEFAHLAELKHLYRFRIAKNALVAQFEVLGVKAEEIVQEGEAALPPPPPPKEKIEEEGAATLMDMMGFMISHMNEKEILFPNVELSVDDKSKLYAWTQEKEWKFIDHEEGGVTLTKRDVPEEVLWSPSST